MLNEKNSCNNKYSDFLSKIGGSGTVNTFLDIIPNEEKFDFGYLDKKIHETTDEEIILKEDICLEKYEKDFYEGGIELDIDNLVIDGNGHTIDASGDSRIFIITGENITLKNIIFENGHSHNNYDNPINNHGGALRINSHNNLTIINCEFKNNNSERNGGVISGGNINISESKFTENTAQNDGGVIYSYGGELIITESKFTENTAEMHGGAIYNNDGNLTIVGSIFTRNTATYGGAIYCSILIIKESIFASNKATWSCGAVHGGPGTITGTEFENNYAEMFNGAIPNPGGLTITDSTFHNNEVGEKYRLW